MFMKLRTTLTVMAVGSLLAVTACTNGATSASETDAAQSGTTTLSESASAKNRTDSPRAYPKGTPAPTAEPTEAAPAPEAPAAEPVATGPEPTEPAPGIEAPAPDPTAVAPAPATGDEFIFGLGSQAYQIEREPLVQQAPVGMYTSWYNFPSDLSFFDQYRTSVTPQTYAAGKAMHLVVWTAQDKDGMVSTKYGDVCGAKYPLSAQFQEDMKRLAINTAGTADGPPLYVSMFTEFQTYPCQEQGNYWDTGYKYYAALKDSYRQAKATFHQYAPNAKVALTWGGWAANFDDPARGGGKSLLPHFADVMNESDFQSFQLMSNTDNKLQIDWMTAALSQYGNGKSMAAHFKPDNDSAAVYDRDMAAIFTPESMASLKANGLFGFSFMDPELLGSTSARFEQAKSVIQTYAKPAS